MRWFGKSFTSVLIVTAMVFVTALAVRVVGASSPASSAGDQTVPAKGAAAPAAAAPVDIVARGRYLVISHACGECHGGGDDPSAKGWLIGVTKPADEFKIGPPPCGIDLKATGCFTTRPRN